MINKITLENFRVFKEPEAFKLAPLTILTGKNNTGKSSLIKSLQLLKANTLDYKGFSVLNFEKGKHQLGSFKNVVNNEATKNEFSISFDFPIEYFKEPGEIKLTFFQDNKIKERGRLKSVDVYHNGTQIIHFKENYDLYGNYDASDFSKEEGEEILKDFEVNLKYIHNYLIEEFEYIQEAFRKEMHEKELKNKDFSLEEEMLKSGKIFTPAAFKLEAIDLINYNNNIYNSKFKRIISLTDEQKKRIMDINLNQPLIEYNDVIAQSRFDEFYEEMDESFQIFEIGYKGSEDRELYRNLLAFLEYNLKNSYFNVVDIINFKIKEKYDYDLTDLINTSHVSDLYNLIVQDILITSLKSFDKFIEKSLKSTHHLSSVRAFQTRLYQHNSELSEFHEIISKYAEIGANEDKIEKFIKSNLKRFEIGEALEVKNIQGVASELYLKRKDKKILLADLGFGYTQLLPLILKIAIMAKENFHGEVGDLFEYSRSTLLLEEPEGNLHPALQSKIADLLIEAGTLFNIQFIVETHSEYLIRKFQYFVASKSTEMTEEDVVIYYINSNAEMDFREPKVKEIRINQFGGLTDTFGSGFYDESTKLQFELTRINNIQKN